jgi:Domain of unknown function (DUF397)
MTEQLHLVSPWRKSAASGDSNCVEVASSRAAVLVRDSKCPEWPILSVPYSAWLTFIDAIHNEDARIGRAK